MTQPAPDGRGARLAMRRAMDAAQVGVLDVAYINAHATGTPQGDAVEAQAIADVFQGQPGAACLCDCTNIILPLEKSLQEG